MILSHKIRKLVLDQEGWTRKMFEAGIRMKKDFGVENVYDFSLGNPDTEPPAVLKERLVELLQEQTAGTHRYMPNNGYEQVREEIAEYLRASFGLPFTSSHVFMTVGCAGGLNIVLKAMLNRGDEVIVPSPFFWEYKNYIENFGAVIKTVDTKEDFQLDIGNIERALSARTRAVLITSPNNPTGAVYNEESLRQLADLLYARRRKGKEIYILSDEAYRKIVYSDCVLPDLFNIYDLVIAVTSHSKDLALPGERIGYVSISPRIADAPLLVSGLMIAIRSLGFVNAPALFQRAVGAFQGLSVSVADYEKKRDVLYRTLVEAGFECVKPQGAFYLFPKSPLPDEVEFIMKMQEEERILLVPGRGFGKEGYFRIAFCIPMETILKALPGFERAGKRYIAR